MKNEKELTFIINLLENFMTLSKKEQKGSIKILKKNYKRVKNDNLDFVIAVLKNFIKKSYAEQLNIIEDFKLERLKVIM